MIRVLSEPNLSRREVYLILIVGFYCTVKFANTHTVADLVRKSPRNPVGWVSIRAPNPDVKVICMKLSLDSHFLNSCVVNVFRKTVVYVCAWRVEKSASVWRSPSPRWLSTSPHRLRVMLHRCSCDLEISFTRFHRAMKISTFTLSFGIVGETFVLTGSVCQFGVRHKFVCSGESTLAAGETQ